ncbi:hypothetical protein MtrunA17_Chr7g0224901 [Medicago truncatula]|uniref:Uncharacterized protein n=1 Tax=Medicago truncatula TaxID=3880 RepID=A0A396GWR5_MEDTR|nr:hypothetical protein MtrunA17_Chr7g0224901 [Medicago truncatula]
MIIIKEIFAESIYSFPIIPFTHATFFGCICKKSSFFTFCVLLLQRGIVELRVL